MNFIDCVTIRQSIRLCDYMDSIDVNSDKVSKENGNE